MFIYVDSQCIFVKVNIVYTGNTLNITVNLTYGLQTDQALLSTCHIYIYIYIRKLNV